MSAPNPVTHEPLHRDWPPARRRATVEFPSTTGETSESTPAYRAPLTTTRRGTSLWLPLFGAASGMIWAGVLAPIVGWRLWLVVPIIVGAIFGAVLAAS
jgi:hypothetical protein